MNAIRRPSFTLAALACAAALGGCAGVPAGEAAAARDCFFIDSVRGFSPVDDTTVDLSVGVRDVYRLTLYGRCPDIEWDHALALRQRGGASSVCAGQFSGLSVIPVGTPGGVGPSECLVRDVRKLPPKSRDEAATKDGFEQEAAQP